MVEAIPLDLLESVVQKQRGVFLSSGDGGHQWAGSLEVDIQGDPEPEEVLTPLRDFFHNRSGFGAATRSDESGELVDVTGPDGAFWIVRYRRDDHEVAVVFGMLPPPRRDLARGPLLTRLSLACR